eukprot:360255-Chlamydomonas_euryale.AAC.3
MPERAAAAIARASQLVPARAVIPKREASRTRMLFWERISALSSCGGFLPRRQPPCDGEGFPRRSSLPRCFVIG